MRKSRKPLSTARRASRVAVWTVLGVVLLLRYTVFPPDPEFPLLPRLTSWIHQEPAPPPRRRYRPTQISPPQSEVPGDLLRLRIEIAPEGVARLQGYEWSGWRGTPQDRPEALATVHEGGAVYAGVALHLKGAAGSFRPFDDKPALTLNFAKHQPGRRFHGYSKLSLNNSVQDPTFLCEVVCREMFAAAGVPVPRADFATVLINGVDKGLYVLTEGYNRDFLRRYFHNVKGNLYDGGFVRDVHPGMIVNSGDDPEEQSDIERLLAAALVPEADRRWERLGEVLDRDRFVTMLALEILTCHWDGYGLNRNNYRLFHDLEADRMIFMPHGLDQMFDWPPGHFPPEGPIDPAMRGLVAQAVMSTPQGSSRYFERLGELCTNVFSDRVITNRVWELARRIGPTLAAYSPDLKRRHEVLVSSLCDRITRRFRSVAEQVNAPREFAPDDSPMRRPQGNRRFRR